jgi:hypothetical protein
MCSDLERNFCQQRCRAEYFISIKNQNIKTIVKGKDKAEILQSQQLPQLHVEVKSGL